MTAVAGAVQFSDFCGVTRRVPLFHTPMNAMHSPSNGSPTWDASAALLSSRVFPAPAQTPPWDAPPDNFVQRGTTNTVELCRSQSRLPLDEEPQPPHQQFGRLDSRHDRPTGNPSLSTWLRDMMWSEVSLPKPKYSDSLMLTIDHTPGTFVGIRFSVSLMHVSKIQLSSLS